MKTKKIVVVSGLRQSPPLRIEIRELRGVVGISDLYESGGPGL